MNLRKAISATIDRNALVDKILGDGSVVATGLIQKGCRIRRQMTQILLMKIKIVEYSPEKQKNIGQKRRKNWA